MDAARTQDRKRAGSSRERILAAARAEFLDKGFERASLRAIAAAAGVTTGAIYGSFRGKADLFDALVEPAGEGLYQHYLAYERGFFERDLAARTFEGMQRFEEEVVHEVFDFIYDNMDAFRLILTRSAGTRWKDYLDRFAEIEVRSTHRYAEVMSAQGVRTADIPDPLVRMVARLFVEGYFHPVVAGMTRDEAHAYIRDYERFFHAGCRELMQGPFGG